MSVSNPPSLTSIITEFGSGGSPKNLYAYRRGGGIIPDTTDYSSIGTGASGSPLAISQFTGKSAITNWLSVVYYAGASSSVGGLTDSVAMDSSGNIYIAGRVITTSTSSNAIIVIKLSKTGSVVWIKNTVDPNPSAPVYNMVNNRVSLNIDTNSNVYVVSTVTRFSGGAYDGGIIAMKFDTNGNNLWNRFITGGAGSEFAENSCVDNSGNLYIAGGTSQDAPSGYLSAYDTYTIKLDTNGNSVWQMTHRTNDENYFTSCWTDGTYLYCTGEYNWYGGIQLMKYNCSNGGLVGNWYYVNGRSGYGTGITGDNQGYLYLQGACSDPSYYYPVITKVNASNGAVIWQKWFDAYGGGPEVTSLKYDPNTGYLFAFVDNSGIVCMNASNGAVIWQRDFAGSKVSFDVDSSCLVLNGGYWVQPQYSQGSGIWRTARLPKDGSKTGTYSTTPSAYSISYNVMSLAEHAPLNGAASLRGGGGSQIARAFSVTSTTLSFANGSTSSFEKAVI